MPEAHGGRVLTGALGYLSERVLRLALGVAVGVFVARYLGPDGLGLLSFASSAFGLLAPFALLGLPTILVREFSTRRDWEPVLSAAVSRQLPAAVAASVVGFAIVVLGRGGTREAVLLAAVLLPMPILGVSTTARSYLEAHGKVRRIAVTGALAGVVASAWQLAGLATAAPVWFFGAAISVEAAVTAVGLVRGVSLPRSRSRLRDSRAATVGRDLLRESWPLLLSSVAVTIYMQADLLMLGVLSGDTETGIYAAAVRLSEVSYFIPTAAAAAVRPGLARAFAERDLLRYDADTQRFLTALAAVAYVVVAVVLVTSGPVVRLLYGEVFAASAPVLRVHVLAAPFVFLGVGGSQWFVDRALTRSVMVRSVVGAVLNVVLNLVLIPPLGATGAAIATLCAYSTSGMLANGVGRTTRPIFRQQVRALVLYWPRATAGRPTS